MNSLFADLSSNVNQDRFLQSTQWARGLYLCSLPVFRQLINKNQPVYLYPFAYIVADVGRILTNRGIHYTFIQVTGCHLKVKPEPSPVPTVVKSASDWSCQMAQSWHLFVDLVIWHIISTHSYNQMHSKSVQNTCKAPVIIAFTCIVLGIEIRKHLCRRRPSWKKGWIVSNFYAVHYRSRGHGGSCQHQVPDKATKEHTVTKVTT